MPTSKNITNEAREIIGFGVKDSRGREIGCIVTRNEVTYVETDTTYGYGVPAGDYVEVVVQAARDGVRYGAFPGSKLWAAAQADGAEPYIARRIADSRKAAAKKGAA